MPLYSFLFKLNLLSQQQTVTLRDSFSSNSPYHKTLQSSAFPTKYHFISALALPATSPKPNVLSYSAVIEFTGKSGFGVWVYSFLVNKLGSAKGQDNTLQKLTRSKKVAQQS